jgi:hypothetical protein
MPQTHAHTYTNMKYVPTCGTCQHLLVVYVYLFVDTHTYMHACIYVFRLQNCCITFSLCAYTHTHTYIL